jgi:hypothetical protein
LTLLVLYTILLIVVSYFEYTYISCRCHEILSSLEFEFCGFLIPFLNPKFKMHCGGTCVIYKDIQCRWVKIVSDLWRRLSHSHSGPALYWHRRAWGRTRLVIPYIYRRRTYLISPPYFF